jgi:hypothetical protein
LTLQSTNARRIWLLAPVFGAFLFVCLYIAAAFYYPGGSQLDKNSKGFSWSQNYWCNLLNEIAMNGEHNPARPVALFATIVLCVTLALFWYLFPQQAGLSKRLRRTIQISGVIAMSIGAFLFTSAHNVVINIATLFGLVAVVGTFIGLRNLKWYRLYWFGLFTIVLVMLNNILYYGKGLRFYLPVIQKITFLYFLLWICTISIKSFQKSATLAVVKT